MAEKTYPMTLEEKEKLEKELEELKLVRRPEVENALRLPVHTETFLKTVNTKQLRMNKPLSKDKSLAWKQKFAMLKSSIATQLLKMK